MMGRKDERSHLLDSIANFRQELEWAKRKLEEATKNRLRAHEEEDQWHAEVTSLQKLIEVREKRLSPDTTGSPTPQSVEQVRLATESRMDPDIGGKPDSHANAEGMNRVEWITGLVAASGTRGIAPPEILEKARGIGLKMHPNYPYVVLRKLIDRATIVKKGGRYYRKESLG